MTYTVTIHQEQEQYVAIAPDLGYTSSYGDSIEEALAQLTQACELYTEDLTEFPKARTLAELKEAGEISKDKKPYSIELTPVQN